MRHAYLGWAAFLLLCRGRLCTNGGCFATCVYLERAEKEEKKEERGFTDEDNLKIGTAYIGLMYTASTLHKEIIFCTHHIVLLAPRCQRPRPALAPMPRDRLVLARSLIAGHFRAEFHHCSQQPKGECCATCFLLIPNQPVTSFSGPVHPSALLSDSHYNDGRRENNRQ